MAQRCYPKLAVSFRYRSSSSVFSRPRTLFLWGYRPYYWRISKCSSAHFLFKLKILQRSFIPFCCSSSIISWMMSTHSWQSSTDSECIRGIMIKSFSKFLKSLNSSYLLMILLVNPSDMWSKLNASALPLKILRLNWSHRIIVAKMPSLVPIQCLTLPWPISIRSCLNMSVISWSTWGPPANHLFIIWGGIVECRSQPFSMGAGGAGITLLPFYYCCYCYGVDAVELPFFSSSLSGSFLSS